MSEAAFDYARAARDAGWRPVGDIWIKETGECYGWNTGGRRPTVRELCFFLGKGPEWEAWKQEPYRESGQ